MMKQKFTLFLSVALMLLVWLVPKDMSAQIIKCPHGMKNLDSVKYHLGCGDWMEVSFVGNPSYTYTVSIVKASGANYALGSFKGSTGKYTAGSVKSKFNPMTDSLLIAQNCGPVASTSTDYFKGALPKDLSMAGTWTFKPDATSTLNTPWKAVEFTSASPTNVPDVKIDPDNGQAWAPSCKAGSDGKWTFGAYVRGTVPAYGGLDSLRYELKPTTANSKTGSGTFPLSGISTKHGKVTVSGFKEGAVAANIIAYAGSCRDTVMVMNVVPGGHNEPTVACDDQIHVSVDAQCMADLVPSMMLAGIVDQCMLSLMDSIVVKHASGALLDTSNYSYKDSILRIENASQYIHGKKLIAEIYASDGDISNYCWGNLVFEDKLAPILECDTLKTIKCIYFDGDPASHVKAWDCDPNPKINLVNHQIITDCNKIGSGGPKDSIIKRIIRTFRATDSWGNTSKACTDTLDIKRLDSDPSNNTGALTDPLDIEGLVYPKNYVSYFHSGSKTDTTAFVCDSRFPFADIDHDHIPDPVDYIVNSRGDTLKGAGVPKIDTVINGKRWLFKLHPSNYVNVHKNVAKLLETCKSVVTYKDTKLPRIGCVEKVLRQWEIREWVCGHETKRTFNQTIEIVDTIGPDFKVGPNMKVSTNLKTCERYMKIPAPTDINDFCKKSDPSHIIVNAYNDSLPIGSISTMNGSFHAVDGGYMKLPIGRNKIEYNVFDNCHNVSKDTIYITVVDETAPVAICKEFLVVGIADDGEKGNGEVWVRAESIDNGSYDDCGLKDMCIARMDDLDAFDALEAGSIGGRLTPHGPWYVPLTELNVGCDRKFEKSGSLIIHEDNDPLKRAIDTIDYIFREHLCTPKLRLCCEDVGKPTMVLFRVRDKAGNKNECMVEIEAQDKRRPVVHCPPDLTIDCRYTFNEDSLLSVFGNVVEEGQQKAINIDPGFILGVEKGKSLSDGVFFGNCMATVDVTVEKNINECRSGTITRTFVVTANNGNTTKCKQVITFSRKNVLKAEDIKFPRDTVIETCAQPEMFTPEQTGYPQVDEKECTLIGWAFEDLVVRFNNDEGDACFKIIREWTVIDWCKVPSYTIATHSQIIKINDLIDPTIEGNENGKCADKIADILDAECKDGYIELIQRASDNCTDGQNLAWKIGIDLDNDNSINRSRTFIDSVADISGDYPIGTHRIIWEVRDQCGNRDVCEQLFTIRNIKEPTPVCITTLTGSLMPVDNGSSQNGQPNDHVAGDGIADGGMLTLWANEYNIGSSFHPCGYELIYSFAADSIVPARDFDCTDLGDINLTVHVLAVEGFGDKKKIVSSDFCSVIFNLDDNNNTCDETILNPASVLITGNIHTEDRENLPTVEVALEAINNGASTNATSTDLSGIYAFQDMPVGGTYKVVPTLNKDILNGVSTLDLVLIQKHILGLELLDSPYKIIAGDVTKDGNISAIDLVELRKLILGVSDEFNNNNSWRFVDDNYTFISPNDPLNEEFKEIYNIHELTRTMILDFVGIKVGDVNGNVNVSGLLTAPRSKATVVMDDVSFGAGDVVNVPVSFKGVENILGFQFTLEYDQNAITYTGFEPGALKISGENFGTQGVKDGFLTTSWGTVQKENVVDNEAFVLSFKAQTSGQLSDILHVTSSVTTAEAYNDDKEVMGLNLEFNTVGEDVIAGFELFQNTPNPFAQTTTIGFMLPTDADATINIFDVTGKLLKGYSGSFTQGLNTIVVDKNDLNTSGVLYYTLDTQGFTSTRRMVLLK